MKNSEVCYPLRVFIFILLFPLLAPPLFVVSEPQSHIPIIGVILLLIFYSEMIIFTILDRERLAKSFFLYTSLSDYLLIKKIMSVFEDKLRRNFGENSKNVSKILMKQIRHNRKKKLEFNSTVQIALDHLMKEIAREICKPVCHFELAEESIAGMRGSPDAFSSERIRDIFEKEIGSRENIKLLRKDFDFYLFLASASGLKVWPRMEGYIAQQLPEL